MNIPKVFQQFLILIPSIIVGCTPLVENIGTSSPEGLANSATPPTIVVPTSTFTSIGPPMTVQALPMEEARERLLELLATNGGCDLPCLWGITPGKSNDLEAQTILLPLSNIAETIYFNQPKVNGVLLGAITPLYVENDFRMNVRVAYTYGDDGLVTRIGFRVLEEQVVPDPGDPSGESWINKTPIYGSPNFIKRVEYFSLSHFLSELGPPDSVMIRTSAPSLNRTGSIVFYLAVLYPNRGIWAQYTTLTNENEVGSIIQSCPINAHIEMELYPPGSQDSFFAFLEKTDWGRAKDGYKPLEEATSLSLEEFYEIFKTSTNQCIETSVDLWPAPASDR